MTRGAVPISRVRHIVRGRLRGNTLAAAAGAAARMALETNCEQNRPPQQARIRRAMRKVAGFATVHANRGMLEQEGASLIRVAL
jgi:hypothetical protein